MTLARIQEMHCSPADRPLRLGIFGVLGSGNIGNDGSLDTVVGYLRDQHPDVELGFLVMGPTRLEERYHAPATHLQWYESNVERLGWVPAALLKALGRLLDPFRTLAWVRHYDVLIVPGMGVLETTVPMRPWGFPYGLFSVCLCARLTRTRVAMICVGADVIHKRISRWLIMSAARLAHYRSFRDVHSRNAMRAMGLDVEADEVYSDLAFLHTVPVASPDGRRTVGLGLMDYWGNNDEREHGAELHSAYMDTMKRFAHWIIDAGRPIRFFTCDPADSEVVQEIIDDLLAQRPELDPTMVVDEPATTIQQLMAQIAQVDAVVATRYHNVLSAVLSSAPTVSIGYSPKHEELMANVGLGEFCQPARSVSFERLVDQFLAVERRRADLTLAMRRRNRQNVCNVRKQLATMSEVILAPRQRAEVHLLPPFPNSSELPRNR